MFALRRLVVFFLPALLLSSPSAGETTVGWRTDGTGRYPDAAPPLRWSKTENVVWKVALPGRGSDAGAVAGLSVGAVAGLGLFLHPIVLGEVVLAWTWWIPVSASLATAVTLAWRAGRADEIR